jgi:hypothetical protein
MAHSREAMADFTAYVLVPFTVSTLAFVFLIWLRDPAGFGEKWPIAFVGSGVIGIFALIGFVARGGKVRLGIWRHFI